MKLCVIPFELELPRSDSLLFFHKYAQISLSVSLEQLFYYLFRRVYRIFLSLSALSILLENFVYLLYLAYSFVLSSCPF